MSGVKVDSFNPRKCSEMVLLRIQLRRLIRRRGSVSVDFSFGMISSTRLD